MSCTRHPRLADQRGLTLVELLIAMSIFIVIALSSGILFASVLKLSAKSKLVEEIQREGDAVVANYARNLRDTVSVDTANSNFVTDPNTLQVRLSTDQTRKYVVTSGQLHYIGEDGVDQNLLLPGTTISSLTYTPASDSTGLQVVTIRLNLSRTKAGQTQTLNFGSTVSTRPQ